MERFEKERSGKREQGKLCKMNEKAIEKREIGHGWINRRRTKKGDGDGG